MAKKASPKKKAAKKAVKKSVKKAAPKKSKKTPAKKAGKIVKKATPKKAAKKIIKKAAPKKAKKAVPLPAGKAGKKTVKKTAPKPIKKAAPAKNIAPVKKSPKPVSPAKTSVKPSGTGKSAFTVSMNIMGFNTNVNAGPGNNPQLFFRYFSIGQHQLQVDRVSGFSGGEQVLEKNIGDHTIRSVGHSKSSPDLLRKIVLRHELIVIFRSHPVNDQHHGGDRVLFNSSHSKELDLKRETNLGTLLADAHSAMHLVEPTVPLLHDYLEGKFQEDLSTLAVKIRIHMEADTEEERNEGCYVELFLRPGSKA